MRNPSQITEETNRVLDKIFDLEWELKDNKKRFKSLNKELEHWIKYNQTIKLT